MTTVAATDLLQQALLTTASLAGPILVISLIVGLFVSVIQAATQINEQTLTFLPKLVVVAAVLWMGGPWMLGTLMTFTRTIFESLPAAAKSSFAIPAAQGTALLLVLLRTAGFVVTAPILGHRAVPATVKAGAAAVLAVNLAGHVAVAASPMDFLIAAPIELMIGLALGFLLSLGFQAVEMIGRLIALQTGLSLGQAINPADESTGTTLDPLFSVLAGLTFLALNLHVAIIQALDHSFTPFPLGSGMAPGFIVFASQLTALALELGTRIALPLALALLLVQVAIALLARAIPQINVFILGAPITLLGGLLLTAAAMPLLVSGASAIFETILRAVATGTIS